MMKSILWKGIEYHSLESCTIQNNENALKVDSTIIGEYHNIVYKVIYQIQTTSDGEITYFKITSEINKKKRFISFRSDGKGNWWKNGKEVKKYKGCHYIDISLTPFTNTLPINRLNLETKEAFIIKVLYIDVLENKTKTTQQKYTRLSNLKYRYENIPNDFEAVISVDDLGLVINYPKLFDRISIM